MHSANRQSGSVPANSGPPLRTGTAFAVFFDRGSGAPPYFSENAVVKSVFNHSHSSWSDSPARGEGVPELMIRGAEMLDRARKVCETIDRRAQAALHSPENRADGKSGSPALNQPHQ
jgi:hypothetical protein